MALEGRKKVVEARLIHVSTLEALEKKTVAAYLDAEASTREKLRSHLHAAAARKVAVDSDAREAEIAIQPEIEA